MDFWERSARRCCWRRHDGAGNHQPVERLREARLHFRRPPGVRGVSAHCGAGQAVVLARALSGLPSASGARAAHQGISSGLPRPAEYLRQSGGGGGLGELLRARGDDFRPGAQDVAGGYQPRRTVRLQLGGEASGQGECDLLRIAGLRYEELAGRQGQGPGQRQGLAGGTGGLRLHGRADAALPWQSDRTKWRRWPRARSRSCTWSAIATSWCRRRRTATSSPSATGARAEPIEVYRNTGMPDSLNGHHFPLDDPGRIVNFVLGTRRGWSAWPAQA